MNRNFRDMLAALSEENADFLIVGAFALAHHGFPRFTGDPDLWIRRSRENTQRVWNALKRFRAPMRRLRLQDLEDEDIVFQVGVSPQRIDIFTSVSGIEFEEAGVRRSFLTVDGRQIPVLSKTDLIKNKRAAGRPKDLIDVMWLESETEEDD